MRELLLYIEAEAETVDTAVSGKEQNNSLVENRFLMNHTNVKYLLYSGDGRLILSNHQMKEEEVKRLGNFIVLDFKKDMVDTDYIGSLSLSDYM